MPSLFMDHFPLAFDTLISKLRKKNFEQVPSNQLRRKI